MSEPDCLCNLVYRDWPTGGQPPLSSVCFFVFKQGKSAASLSVNKRPTECMFISQEHLFSGRPAGHEARPSAAEQATDLTAGKQKTGHRSDLVGLYTPLYPPFPFSLRCCVLSSPLAAVKKREISHENCHELWEWDC